MSKRFASLHNHTEMGSHLDGMNDVKQMFIRAKKIGYPAIATTDHGTMAAIYDSWKASKEVGIKFIPGIEIYFADDLSQKKSNHLVLLAQNEQGYRNLLRLNYEAYKNQVAVYMGKYIPRITWHHLWRHNEGVIALTACSNGLIAKTLITEQDRPLALDYLERFRKIFGDRLYLELQPHNLYHIDSNGKEVNQLRLNNELLKLSAEFNIPYVITCDAHYLDQEQAEYHDAMLAIKDKKPLNDPDRFRYGVQDMYLKTENEIVDFFGEAIAAQAIKNINQIIDRCEEPSYLEPRGAALPVFPVQEENNYDTFKIWHHRYCLDVDEDKAYLRYKCVQAFTNKFSDLPIKTKTEYWERVVTELNVLEGKGFSSYMLIVADYIQWAKKQKMPVGVARGSAAGSLVAYLIGITGLDPIKYDLIFERFHNSEKTSFPDIDSDFADPSKVKEYIKEKYGEDRVASISNWSTLSPKVIIKDVARSLLLGGDKSSAFKIANYITDIMPDEKTIEEAMENSPEFTKYMNQYPELYRIASKLQGLTRNWSVHAAGIIIGNQPLYETIPLRIDPKTGLVVAQWEKTRCEENGYVKMDLLGLKTLVVIDEAFRLIKQQHHQKFTIEDIPLDDKATFDMISRGETTGVFQLEASLTPLCMKIKPKCVKDIADINAMGRPSCSNVQRESYIARRLGQKPVEYRHQNLERALAKTYGISLYEEGMMTIAKDCAGWNFNQADALRKITKLKGKKPELVLRTQASFIEDCVKHSKMTSSKAKEIWAEEIEPFGLYGFNLSHSISYSHISYYTAWLKCHYPTEFMCALLNSENPNDDKSLEYLLACRDIGIEITPPNINSSRGNYVIVGPNQIATGFSAIKGIGETAVVDILLKQPFRDFKDFLYRTNSRVVNKRIIQALAKAGAFDQLNVTRKDVFENYGTYRTKINAQIKNKKSIEEITWPAYNIEWERKELLLGEREVLGRIISGSLEEVYEGFFRKNEYMVTPLSQISQYPKDSKVKIEVILNSKVKELKIKQGKNKNRKFAKYIVEDLYGSTTEMTVWPDEYEKYRLVFNDGIPIRAICKVDEYLGQRSLSLAYLEGVYGVKHGSM